MSDGPVDPSSCPLCGEANECALAAGASTCWCFQLTVPADVLERVPAEAQAVACVCQACISGRKTPAAKLRELHQLLRRR